MKRGYTQRALVAAAGVTLLAAAAGCPTETHGTGGSGGGAAPAWATVYEGKDLGGAVLSVWGSGPDDVFVVGGPLGNSGFEAVVQHFDGVSWETLAPGGADSFWWVSGTGPKDVWMSGEHGRITHWDGLTFHTFAPLTTSTLWGVWPAGPDDVWAVGGTPGGGAAADNDVVLHFDGAAWTKEALPMQLGRSINKVWGASADDVYAVGEAGTIWHRKGGAWSLEASPATSNLLTVHGCSAAEVYAVGGQDVLRSDGVTWSKVDVKLTNSVNGVTCSPSGDVLIVGFGGLKQRRAGGQWINEFAAEPHGDLHGAWSDGRGAFWAAGGDFIAKASAGVARKAIIGRYGVGIVPAPTP